MKTRTLSAILLMVCCMYSSNNWAWGHHHGGHFGFYGAPIVGFGLGYGLGAYPYGYGGYGYSPPAVIVAPPPAPTTYIQQAPVVQQAQTNYWHYCSNPQGYYPYVKQCPGGWQLVPPTPQ